MNRCTLWLCLVGSILINIIRISEETLNTDLDDYSRTNPSNREILLWLIINIPGKDAREGRVYKGDTLVEYLGPRPQRNSGMFNLQ